MNRAPYRAALGALVLVLAPAAAARAPAQEAAPGLRADLARDIAGLESKYLDLADAMPAAVWEWRPMEGVRSSGEVICHVAGANFRIPGFFGVEPPEEAETLGSACGAEDPSALKAAAPAALAASFAFAARAVDAVPDARLDEATQLFGRETTVRAAMLLYVTHMHEHLGQLVAYARSNGVVPPWSAGG